MEKKSILFVDDEPNILSGLNRMLRGLRKEMDLSFVNSGAEALDFLAQNKVDVIVTDMRMPGMDGATLLDRKSVV
jgi:CheY-like chemotaxis protein